MNYCTEKEIKSQVTPRTTLVAVGHKVRQMKIMETIGEYVKIKQKVVKDSPLEKLTDGLMTILAGGKGLVEANKVVRTDPALQRAFGRDRCAEQSVISQTLDACDSENVAQMRQAWRVLYQQHSQSYRHDYEQSEQVLDIDLTGQPCGRKAAFASKGYFAHQRNRRGRQLGRVWASWYEEIVIDHLCEGKTTLHSVLPELVNQAIELLELDPAKRVRTILRIDAHGGHISQVNNLLQLGFQLHTKEGHPGRSKALAESVTTWYDDPQVPGRQVGWVNPAPTEYVRPVTRVAVRTRKKNGQWGYGVLISTLSPVELGFLLGFTADQLALPLYQLLAFVYFYDQRSGGIETGFKSDKQALGISKRNKKRFAAQQVMTFLNALAHNLLVWFQFWLAQRWAGVSRFGLARFMREVLTISGTVFFDDLQQISMIVFNSCDPLSQPLVLALRQLLSPWDIVFILD